MIDIINGIAELWWGWMGPMLWQVSLLIVVIGVIDRLIHRWAWPEIRHALWLLVLVKLVIPPSWSVSGAIFPRLLEPARQQIVQRMAERDIAAAETSVAEEISPTAGRETMPLPGLGGTAPAPGAATAASRPSWKVSALAVWMIGMIGVTALLLNRTARLRRWHQEQVEKRTVPPWFLDLMVATAERLKLSRLPAIVFSDEIAAPAVYGVFNPVLLLPASSATLDREDAEHVLLHELAHLKRGDLWLHGLCLVLQVVYWFNPLLIWARRQLKHVRELCCDITVATHLREKTMEYRKTLLETARRLLSENTEPALALLGVFEEPFRLVARLRWLEKETWRRRTPALLTAALVMIIGVPVLLPMAAADSMGTFDDSYSAARTESHRQTERAGSGSGRRGLAVYVRNEFKFEDLVLGVPIHSELWAVSETWIGDDIIAGTERGRTVIVDRAQQRLLYVDHKHRTWVESPLPLDIPTLFCEHSLKTHQKRRSSGEVTETRRTRRILGRKCRQYDVHSWHVGDGRIHTEEWIKVWASTDVPFDLSLYDDMLYNMRLIYNRDAIYRSELEKIEGLQMGLELRSGNFLRGRRYFDETVRMEARTPPRGTFSAPAGYTKKERIEDFEF
jgi:beta-lactamase regulating signal transducer with metallopeptidase domain